MSKSGMGELVSEVARLHDKIEELSYYDFLAVSPKTDYIGIRDAFYTRAQLFHPDRFVAMQGESVKKAVYSVYKRMTEAYQVLSDPERRAKYDVIYSQQREGRWKPFHRAGWREWLYRDPYRAQDRG